MKANLLISVIVIFISNLQYSLQDLIVLGPESLKKSILADNKLSEGEIRSKNGNFGELPFGKTIIGSLYVHDIQNSENNDWCDDKIFKYIPKSSLMFSTIVLANDKNCAFTQKAFNVQKAGGAALIIYSQSQFFDFDKNVDDVEFGSNLNIPTKIINNSSGQKLLDKAVTLEKEGSNEKIVLSLSFKAISDPSHKIKFNLFMRSDQVKALHFFQEFQGYKEILKDRLEFTPYYYYNPCYDCKSNYNLDQDDNSGYGCIGIYCGSVTPELNIFNGKLVAIENIRQKCIFEVQNNKYWDYMVSFSNICADLTKPDFTIDCSKRVMNSVQIDQTPVDDCMNNNTKLAANNNEDNLFRSDYKAFQEGHVHRYPTIELNGIKYKASWYAKHIFHSICTGLDDDICDQNTENHSASSSGLSTGLIVLIVVVIIFTMLLIAYCYRRFVNRMIESSIEERIYKQTQESIGNYSKMENA